jgi:predicted PurR-regulated permease PerM
VLIVLVTWGTSGLTDASILALVLVVYQQIENHVLQPVIQRRTIDMNPLMIVLVMLIGTAVSGLLGAILALPLAAALQVLLDEWLARRRARWGEAAPAAGPERRGG